MVKLMLTEIKQMTVNLLLTVIQTDEAGQRDIYKCPRIRVATSTRMVRMMILKVVFSIRIYVLRGIIIETQ